MNEHCAVSGVRLESKRARGVNSALSRLLDDLRRDREQAALIAAEYVPVNHATVHALLAIIGEQQRALEGVAQDDSHLVNNYIDRQRMATTAIARVEVLAGETRP